ncbi:hypothetical protein [Candidatus Coxiella mudrowiae]|uniref:Uncharacterized protein n=1 Tax=Candidatus Coxiella mudrowiae TaxID=2054173 RepID=A0ABM5UUF7_9COXI|nr:hypothetical protein [Candidatus Coxiella mudrowiae]AKQ33624.1 hypothetical protein CleRT_08390 [Candidatus Coxiella mudrowiae]
MDQEIKLKLIEERFTFHDIRAMTVTFMADKERVRSSKSRNVAGGTTLLLKLQSKCMRGAMFKSEYQQSEEIILDISHYVRQDAFCKKKIKKV